MNQTNRRTPAALLSVSRFNANEVNEIRLIFVFAALLASSGVLICSAIREPATAVFLITTLAICSTFAYIRNLPSPGGYVLFPAAMAALVTCYFFADLFFLTGALIGVVAVGVVFITARNSCGWLVAGMTTWLTLLSFWLILGSLSIWLGWYLFDTSLFNYLLFLPSQLAIDMAWGEGQLYMSDERSVYALKYSSEEIPLLWAFRFVLGVLFLKSLWKGKPWNWRVFVAIAMAVIAVFWISAFIKVAIWRVTHHPFVFIDGWVATLAEIGSVVLLLPFLKCISAPGQTADDPVANQPTSAAGIPFGLRALIIGTAACCILFATWYPTGIRKSTARLLIDDSHSDWESSDKPFDFSEEGYGRLSAYSYTSFVRHLDSKYDVTVNHSSPLESKLLEDIDVLLLKTPTRDFSAHEISAIDRFVRNGGGLFIHSDHTDLYGMSSFLNHLIAPAGMRFNLDDQATYLGDISAYQKTWGAKHPTLNQVNHFGFLTSCTITPGNWLMEPVLTSRQAFSEELRYGRPGYFGDMHYGPADRPGELLQAAVVPHGQGRIAMFGDSTVYSNFAFGQSGYRGYADATVEYLLHRHQNVRKWIGILMITLLSTTGIGFVWTYFYNPAPTWSISSSVLYGIAIGGLMSASLAFSDESDFANACRRAGGNSEVAMVLGDAMVDPPLTESGNLHNDFREFSSFLMAWARLGADSQVYDSLETIPDDADVIALINPNVKPTATDLAELKEKASQGASVLILDSLAVPTSTAGEYLAAFGAEKYFQRKLHRPNSPLRMPDLRKLDQDSNIPVLLMNAILRDGTMPVEMKNPTLDGIQTTLAARNMQMLEVDSNDSCLLYTSPYGQGRLYYATGSERFSGAMIGRGSVNKPLTDTERKNLTRLKPILENIMPASRTGLGD